MLEHDGLLHGDVGASELGGGIDVHAAQRGALRVRMLQGFSVQAPGCLVRENSAPLPQPCRLSRCLVHESSAPMMKGLLRGPPPSTLHRIPPCRPPLPYPLPHTSSAAAEAATSAATSAARRSSDSRSAMPNDTWYSATPPSPTRACKSRQQLLLFPVARAVVQGGPSRAVVQGGPSRAVVPGGPSRRSSPPTHR
jgi:hypothetical protein